MALEYYLVPNHMTTDPDDFMAVSSNSNSYSIEDVYKQMTREGSTITKAEALAVFEEITQAIVGILEEGHSIVTPLVNITSGVSGVFESEEDRFDSSRHKVRLNISAGKRLREINGSISPVIGSSGIRKPTLTRFYDNASETQNELITPEGGARLKGSFLKFDEEDDDQGIFFIDLSDNTEHRVDKPLLRNKPGELIFILPDLPAGDYRLEVRSIIPYTTTIRTGRLTDELTVSGSS